MALINTSIKFWYIGLSTFWSVFRKLLKYVLLENELIAFFIFIYSNIGASPDSEPIAIISVILLI